MTEREFYDWLKAKRPDIACAVAYCTSLNDVRRVMNAQTGLEIAPDHDRSDAFEQWKAELEN